MQKKTLIPAFLKGVPREHWVNLASGVMDSRWAQHSSYLSDLGNKALPKAYAQGLREELLLWQEEARQLLELNLLKAHQINKAKMLAKLDIKSATAYVNAKGTLIK